MSLPFHDDATPQASGGRFPRRVARDVADDVAAFLGAVGGSGGGVVVVESVWRTACFEK